MHIYFLACFGLVYGAVAAASDEQGSSGTSTASVDQDLWSVSGNCEAASPLSCSKANLILKEINHLQRSMLAHRGINYTPGTEVPTLHPSMLTPPPKPRLSTDGSRPIAMEVDSLPEPGRTQGFREAEESRVVKDLDGLVTLNQTLNQHTETALNTLKQILSTLEGLKNRVETDLNPEAIAKQIAQALPTQPNEKASEITRIISSTVSTSHTISSFSSTNTQLNPKTPLDRPKNSLLDRPRKMLMDRPMDDSFMDHPKNPSKDSRMNRPRTMPMGSPSDRRMNHPTPTFMDSPLERLVDHPKNPPKEHPKDDSPPKNSSKNSPTTMPRDNPKNSPMESVRDGLMDSLMYGLSGFMGIPMTTSPSMPTHKPNPEPISNPNHNPNHNPHLKPDLEPCPMPNTEPNHNLEPWKLLRPPFKPITMPPPIVIAESLYRVEPMLREQEQQYYKITNAYQQEYQEYQRRRQEQEYQLLHQEDEDDDFGSEPEPGLTIENYINNRREYCLQRMEEEIYSVREGLENMIIAAKDRSRSENHQDSGPTPPDKQ
ncbi:hypothetical protein NEDG_00852 [Nematocida displodere]|uniref:Uncharacterized protein n=1 Tax=Nematocida displodere TaxID=1805483 RepID=A0A177EFF0_9MICR|nr:hypothetical protein NEDG_00852 [Nematocida displodere]